MVECSRFKQSHVDPWLDVVEPRKNVVETSRARSSNDIV